MIWSVDLAGRLWRWLVVECPKPLYVRHQLDGLRLCKPTTTIPRSMPGSQLPEVLLVKSYAVYSFAQYTSVPYRTTGWPGWIFYSTLEDDLHGSNPTLLFTPKQLIVMYVNHLYPPVFHSISSVLIHTQFTMSNKMGFNHQPLISRSVVTTKALRVASWCGVGRTQRGHWWFRMRSTKIGTCPRFTGSYLLVVYVSAPLKVGKNDVYI